MLQVKFPYGFLLMEPSGLLGCDSVLGQWFPIFQKTVPSSSKVKLQKNIFSLLTGLFNLNHTLGGSQMYLNSSR
jgi:hypothetical protein